MIDAPHIAETEAQFAAVIRRAVPRKEIRNVMGPGLTELLGAVADQDIVPTGPVFSHHQKVDPDIFDRRRSEPGHGPDRRELRMRRRII